MSDETGTNLRKDVHLTEFKNMSLEEIIGVVCREKNIVDFLSPHGRSLVFHGGTDLQYLTRDIITEGFISPKSNYNVFSHDILTAISFAKQGGIVTMWDAPAEMMTTGDRIHLGITHPVPATILPETIKGSLRKRSMERTGEETYMPPEHLAMVIIPEPDEIEYLKSCHTPAYVGQYENMAAFIEGFCAGYPRPKQSNIKFHRKGFDMSDDEILTTLCVKMYESMLKSAGHFRHKGADSLESIPTFGIPYYELYKQIKLADQK